MYMKWEMTMMELEAINEQKMRYLFQQDYFFLEIDELCIIYIYISDELPLPIRVLVSSLSQQLDDENFREPESVRGSGKPYISGLGISEISDIQITGRAE